METKTFRQWFEENLSDSAADIARHGADSGFAHITYTNEAAELFDRFADEIWEMLANDAEEFGHKSVPEFVGTFGRADMAESYAGFKNLLVWYACEKVAHEMEDE